MSLAPFEPAHKWQHVEATPAARDRVAAGMAAAASAMSVFDTLLDNRDRHNGGNLLVNEDLATGIIHWAYIDYAYSMTYGWGQGAAPAVASVVARYPGQAPADLTAVANTVQAIEAMQEDAIRSVATRLSPDFIDAARAEVPVKKLIIRECEKLVYGGTAFIKERINLKALKVFENLSRLHAAVMRQLFLFYRSPVTPLPERCRNALL